MAGAYLELIQAEATRAEADLTSFRSRALTVVTTSSGLVTLMTGLITFAASKSEEESGVPDAVIVVLALAFATFLAAAAMALHANAAKGIMRPSGDDLDALTDPASWGSDKGDPNEEERQVAVALMPYVRSMRRVTDDTADRLNLAIRLQLVGLALVAIAGLVAMLTID